MHHIQLSELAHWSAFMLIYLCCFVCSFAELPETERYTIYNRLIYIVGKNIFLNLFSHNFQNFHRRKRGISTVEKELTIVLLTLFVTIAIHAFLFCFCFFNTSRIFPKKKKQRHILHFPWCSAQSIACMCKYHSTCAPAPCSWVVFKSESFVDNLCSINKAG